MPITDLPQTQQKLNKFVSEQRDKILAYLQGTFYMSRSDSEDVFQEAFYVLYKKITEGTLTLTSSLSTYFTGICRNKACEMMRSMGKELNIIDDNPNTTKDEYEDERIDRLIALEDDTEQIEARKEALVREIVSNLPEPCDKILWGVREIVSNLPEPCDKILWGVYRDGFSMKTLATMFGYTSENSVKVTKHRCGEKFKARFSELAKCLF